MAIPLSSREIYPRDVGSADDRQRERERERETTAFPLFSSLLRHTRQRTGVTIFTINAAESRAKPEKMLRSYAGYL